ncbi:uncharacterized protein LOC131073611 [Cryptomeria japonica]|uniref:uncharacterized protein LOC131073611 n=1 Tax=Cryptomeria japonica TaxID=3369 RepID=UPI0027DA936B|nr:uncharacterized protein LOC131073611 [Cryptomeria japonica]
MSIKNGYTISQVPPIDIDAKREYEHNAKAKNVILSVMSNTKFVKVMHFTSAKETCDKLQRINEEDIKVKEAKLQNLITQFEGLKMKEEEKIANYLQRVYEIVNVIRGLGEDLTDELIIKKVLRSLITKYDTKVSTIEEAKDLKTFSMDELFGSVLAYEMRTISGENSKREVDLNSTKKWKEEAINVEEDDSNDVEANFVRKLKQGSGKYRGKLPFKFFDYGKIRYFVANCPYKKKEDNNVEGVKTKLKKFINLREGILERRIDSILLKVMLLMKKVNPKRAAVRMKEK